MFRIQPVCCGIALIAIFLNASQGHSQERKHEKASNAGRIAFDCPVAPRATVEVDVSEGLVADLLGIGEAAAAGLIDALPELAAEHGSPSIDLEEQAKQITVVQQLLAMVSDVFKEAHVRVYRGQSEEDTQLMELRDYYLNKAEQAGWDDVVKINDSNQNVCVCILRESGEIKGVFTMVSGRNETVLVNVVCDVSPDKVRQLTTTSLKVAAALGHDREIRKLIGQVSKPVPNHNTVSKQERRPPS